MHNNPSYMNRLILTSVMLCACLSADARWFPEQKPREKYLGGLEVGICNPISDIGISSNITLGGELSLAGLYMSAGSNRDHAEETKYGAGGESDRHFLMTAAAGYLYTFWSQNHRCLNLLPFLSYQRVEDRMDDAYYGKDKVTKEHNALSLGLGLVYTGRYITLSVKGSEHGISAGISMSVTWFYYPK